MVSCLESRAAQSLLVASVLSFAAPGELHAQATLPAAGAASSARLFSEDDGWFDLSGFLASKYGFLPLAVPITEPAVGYGAAGGLAFIDKPLAGDGVTPGRPNISFAGGLGTQNGTWGVAGGDLRQWRGGRLQTLTGILYASVNLDFYGLGDDVALEDHPLRYNLEPFGGTLQGKHRLGATPVMAGLGYTYATTQVAFDAPAATPGLPDFRQTSNLASLTPLVTFDTRDNLFTPVAGTYAEASCALYSEMLGGDDDLQIARLLGMQYFRPATRLFLGFRGDAKAAYGEVPFYLVPFVSMRGVAMMRYQGRKVGQLETEVRWQFWKRVSAVGFGGVGAARNEFGGESRTRTVGAGGAGLRYELARKFGIHAGIDVAFGPDEPAIYFQTGSAWARP
jgi:hypothetical protein